MEIIDASAIIFAAASSSDQSVYYDEGTSSVEINGLTILDVDVNEVVTASLTLANTSVGLLTSTSGNYDATTGIWTLTDTVANVNTALDALVFTPNHDNDVSTTVSYSIQDGLEDSTVAVTGTINLYAASTGNDAPTINELSSETQLNETDFATGDSHVYNFTSLTATNGVSLEISVIADLGETDEEIDYVLSSNGTDQVGTLFDGFGFEGATSTETLTLTQTELDAILGGGTTLTLTLTPSAEVGDFVAGQQSQVNLTQFGSSTVDLNDGTTTVLTTAHFNISDPDDSSANLTITVANLVDGSITVDGVTNQLSFTLEQVEEGLVVFNHSNAGTLPSFDFSVVDASAASSITVSATTTFLVTSESTLISALSTNYLSYYTEGFYSNFLTTYSFGNLVETLSSDATDVATTVFETNYVMGVDPIAPSGDTQYDSLSTEESDFINDLIDSVNEFLDESVKVETIEEINFRFMDFEESYDVQVASIKLEQKDLDERRALSSILDESFSLFA